ncbi:MAG: helix-turn-helix transcriptional regulator [Candidatus Bipolaricaulota bacterium]|nr:helix-turn-helix transcriptional regulator [Candidatus Bipolaricaulota bacterium]
MIGLGTRLKRFRLQKGWSKRRVAKRLDVSPPSISRWESGEANPNDYNRCKIERLIGENHSDSPLSHIGQGLKLSLSKHHMERGG